MLIACIAIASAKPKAQFLAPLVSAPVVAATSSQVFARNYNGLAAYTAPVAAAYTAPLAYSAYSPYASAYSAYSAPLTYVL